MIRMVNKEIIIDANGSVFGRICSYAAKQALQGNKISVINSEKSIITGNKKDIIEKYKDIVEKGGHSLKGPKYSRVPYKMLKRGIRGMLPDHREGRGRKACLSIKCYDGVPVEFEGKETVKIKGPKSNKFIELKELSERL